MSGISIHVPAWGTTFLLHCKSYNNKFQSTFPRGERLLNGTVHLSSCDFNPRSRVGNDILSCDEYRKYRKISIHVPAWGTTIPIQESIQLSEISIHVPAWGTTGCENDITQYIKISIHVPAWGTTPAEVHGST